MPRKKAVRKKRRTSKKKTTGRRSPRRRKDTAIGRTLVAASAVLGGIAIGWMLVSLYQDREEPRFSRPIPVNVTARGDLLVEIPTREQVASMSADEREQAETQVLAALAEVPNPANEPRPGGSMVVAQGLFKGADDALHGSGTVEVLKATGIRLIVRLVDFQVTNGPSLHVYLAEDAEIPTRNFVDLGRLRGTDGAQNYEISTHYDLHPDEIRYVIIYDELFGRPYAAAKLERTDRWDDRFWINRG